MVHVMQRLLKIQFLFALVAGYFFAGFWNHVSAEVLHQSEQGFNLKIETSVNASPDDAYAQFIRVDEWWQKSHTWFGPDTRLLIEEKAGGCFCEVSGERQVLHMMVTFVDPGVELKMVGGLGPLQMMGLHGGMSWRFEAMEDGTSTRIIQTYNVSGYVPTGMKDLADIVDAVQAGQQAALTRKINSAE